MSSGPDAVGTGGADDARPQDAGEDDVRPRRSPAAWIRAHRAWFFPTGVLAGYLVIAVILTSGMWADPGGRSLSANVHDEALFEWFLARTAHAVTHFDLGLITPLMNAPIGVNVMANTSIIAPGVVLTPITLLFGSAASFVVLLTLGPALTAWTTFLALRRFVRNPGAAVVGGLLFGFCPAMVAQSQGHLHMTLAFLIPPILMQVYDLVATDRSPTIIAGRLAVLTVLQIYIGAEWLFVAAILSVVALGWLALCRPAQVPEVALRLVHGGGLALVVVLVVTAYPLWVLFFGPHSVHGSPFVYGHHSTDLQSYFLPSSLQLVGSSADKAASLGLRGGVTEQNAAMGWPFIVLLCIAAVVLRRRVLARVAAGVALTMAVLSFGPALIVNNKETGLAMPWRYVGEWPVFEAAVPIRFPFAVYLMAAVLVALLIDHVTRARPAVSVAPLTATLLTLALLAPKPFETVEVVPVPPFFHEHVQREIPAGSTVLVVPMATSFFVDPMRWQASSGMRFAMPGGFYIGRAADGRAFINPDTRFTQDVLGLIHPDTPYPPVDESVRVNVREDLDYWDATYVVLGPNTQQAELRNFLTSVLGTEPREVGGVLLWELSPTQRQS